ncbi:hypothetical protein AV530_007294 [Patagioenas fasciata monilis]|uniref:Uncharacterized protein n=1 Tax=Patagioenas fasciata monilis TaxID=372326 RepID=A0A1V4JX86_PATFA|nr:hypothetical protein AV530_007294 [Patagioenas fasciata monilis]
MQESVALARNVLANSSGEGPSCKEPCRTQQLHTSCPLLLVAPFFLCSPLRLQKQQWQQMKMNAMRTTKGRPISTTKQTVLKTPSSCLVRISSKMELKKELIFCSMSVPGQAVCAAPFT